MSPIPKRIAVLALGALCLAGPLTPARAAEIRRISERIIPLEPGGTIHLEDKNGRVTVEGWSRNEVRVQVTRNVRAADPKRAEELMRGLTADIEIRGNKVEIVSRFPKRSESIGFWDVLGKKVAALQIHYYLQVPNESNLTLETSNGDVRVRGVGGRLEASTTNGDIRLDDFRGSATLGTTNGEIGLAGISGTAAARTTNGSVVADMRSVPPKGKVELTTTNGNVQVYMPPDLKADLEAVTTNGRVSIGFPLTTQGVMTSKSVRGTINGGGATVSLATTNGNIEIRRSGENRRP
jgi:putative adhesin